MNRLLLARSVLSMLGLMQLARTLYRQLRSFRRRKSANMILTTGVPPIGEVMYLEPTQKCNLKCEMCYLDFSKMNSLQEIDYDNFRQIIDGLPGKVKHITFTGGEPLISPDFSKMLSYVNNKGFSIALISNLTLTKKVKEVIKNKSIILVNASIDGPRELHNKIRGLSNAYELTKKGIELVNSNYPVGTLMLVCVITESNLDNLGSVVDLAAEVGLKAVEFELERRYDKQAIDRSMAITGYGLEDFRIKESGSIDFPYSLEALKTAVVRVKQYARKKKIKVHFLPDDLVENTEIYYNHNRHEYYQLYCDALDTFRVSSKGEVFSCFAIKKSFGNILETPLEEIWAGQEYINFRQRLLRANLMPICETCYSCKQIAKL